MRTALLILMMTCCGLSARALDVFEGDLSIRGAGDVSLSAGKFWLKIDAQGNGEFQLVLTGFPYQKAAADLQTPNGTVSLNLSNGEARTYAGCDPLGWNPFLSLPFPSSNLTCPSQIKGTFYQGQSPLPPGTRAELLAEQGRIRVTLQSSTATGEVVSTEATGTLQLTGVINERQFFLVPHEKVSVKKDGESLVITWSTERGHSYLVQEKVDWNNSDWVTISQTVNPTDRFLQYTVPLSKEPNRRFLRILRLDPRR